MNNKTNQCLYCYLELTESDQDYHPTCSKKFFGTPTPIQLPYDIEQLKKLSKNVLTRSHQTLEGPAKFSLDLVKTATIELSNYFTITGLDGHYTLKASVSKTPYFAELEDLTMHLARIAQIKTVEHSLIRLESGELAHISQRIDRTKKGKLAMEDMCQLSGTLTEDKYQGSIEKIGKVITSYSSNPGFDMISLFERTLFNFLTGCGDMHLKTFALLTDKHHDTGLSPANDLVPTMLIHTMAKEEMALSVNGKKAKLRKSDFDTLAEKLKINTKTLDNTYKRFQNNLPSMLSFIDSSFLEEDIKQQFKDYIDQKAKVLFDLQAEETKEEIVEAVSIEKVEEKFEKQETQEKQEEPLVQDSSKENKEKEKKHAKLINVKSGEIIDKSDEDPALKRQLNLFG